MPPFNRDYRVNRDHRVNRDYRSSCVFRSKRDQRVGQGSRRSMDSLRSRLRLAIAEGAEGNEDGSAVVEFVFLGMLLLLPVIYLIVTVAQLQSAAYAVTGAADQASKVYVTSADPQHAAQQAEVSVLLALADFGFVAEQAQVAISCEPTDCQAAGSTVTVAVSLKVPLPLIPDLPGASLDAATMESSASQVVGRFR